MRSSLLSVVWMAAALSVAACSPASSKKDSGDGGSGGSGGSGGMGGASGSGAAGGSGGSGGKGGAGGAGGSGGMGGAGGFEPMAGSGFEPGGCGALYRCITEMKCTDSDCGDACATSTGADIDAVALYNAWQDCSNAECCGEGGACGGMDCGNKSATCKKACGSCFYGAVCSGAGAPGTGFCSKDTAKACSTSADCPGDKCVSPADPAKAPCAARVADCFGLPPAKVGCVFPDPSRDTCGGP